MLRIFKTNSKLNFFLFLIQFLISITPSKNACAIGNKVTNADNSGCFNNVIKTATYYRGAQFVTNKGGNMIIEYGKDHTNEHAYRLFYGLKKNGRNYFENENAHKEIKLESNLSSKGRYEARNILLYLEGDTLRDKQYLFSTSAYDTLTELHDIEQGTYSVRSTRDIWGVGELDVFSYQYSLHYIQENNKNIYFLVFTRHENDTIKINNEDKDYSMTIIIKKFGIQSFDLSSFDLKKNISFFDNFNNRIVSSFLLEQKNLLVLFYLKSVDNPNQKEFNNAKYAIRFYDYDLTLKNEVIISNNYVDQPRSGEGLFFKGLHLKDNYAAFLYFTKGYDNTKIKFNISSLVENSGQYSFSNINEFEKEYGFVSDITLNEFIKVNDDQLAFITTKKIGSDSSYYFELHILLYDLYNDYNNIKIRQYNYNLDNIQPFKELTAYVYNDFLIFSSTAVSPVSYTSSDFFSMMTFFGYPNGTDHTIDISPYLMDTGYYTTSNNIYNYLMSNMTVENNIFGYITVQKINLVSIPDELLFYNITNGVQDSTPLPGNTFFDANHVLNQNWQLNKTDKYYSLDYQYIVKEPDYNTFYPSGITEDQPTVSGGYDGSAYYNAHIKTFYGRTNRLSFKLCHDYCGSCVEFSKNTNEQKCFTCLEQYSYDYWAYLGKYIANCVPENMYYDLDPETGTGTLINCGTDFNYLIDVNTGKKICFKPDKSCPDEYSKYNEDTKQCEYTPKPTNQIIETECDYDSYYKKICNFSNDSNSGVLDKVRELVPSYPNNKTSLSVSLDGYSIEISNDQKELLLMNDTDLPWIDLFTCGEKLRAYFRNNSNEPLIIIKYGKISELTYEQELEFEVYDPDTFVKLNLSICNESDINLIINLPLSDELVKALKNIIDQGYDPFDISDKFYREICTPYDSENGTDVLLDAREEYYYSSLNNIVCPDHCHTSSYDLESKYLKCECPVNDTDITLNLKHITGENIGNSFYSTLKNSNWKVMICYNLVFNWEMFKKNKGSIISLIFFIIYLGFIIYFILRGIQPLQVAISKIMFVEMKPELQIDQKDENGNDNSTNANNKSKLKKKKNKKVKIKNNPPKKENSRKINDGIIIVKDSDNTKISSFSDSKKLKSGEKLMTTPNKSKNASFKNKFKKELIYTEGANLKKQEELTKEKEEQMLNLDNFQLNNLEYPDACKYDKRPFLTTYYSVLMREHIILFTFFSWKDYNLFYIKIERFLVLICTQMAMNGLFFSDESMHKANKSDNYNFVQQLPKIIFSLIATHLIEVALCYFSMTDTVYYRIKELAKYKNNDEKIIDEINCMKRKIIAFYVITFLLFLFYWYFISAFCVVYQNTQKTFLLDSLISIIVQFIDPFFIYCFTTLLRYLSLAKCAKNNMECVYKTSYLIPIF